MAAAKKKIPKSKLQPPADPDIWPDIDVLTDEQIARAKRCWDAFDATKIDEVAAADLGGMLRALGYTPTQIVCKFQDGLSDFATLKRKFEVYDTAKTGFITHGQFRKIFSAHGSADPLSLEEVEALLLEADPSKSGRVQYAEWLKTFLAEAKLPLPDMNAK